MGQKAHVSEHVVLLLYMLFETLMKILKYDLAILFTHELK